MPASRPHEDVVVGLCPARAHLKVGATMRLAAALRFGMLGPVQALGNDGSLGVNLHLGL